MEVQKTEFKTLEEATAAVASLQAALEAKEQENKTLAQTNEALTTQVADLNAKLEKELDEASKVISSMVVELEATEKKKAAKNHVVEFEGEKFEFTVPRFQFNGVVITASELKKNDPVIGELLEAGFGGMQLLTSKKKS